MQVQQATPVPQHNLLSPSKLNPSLHFLHVEASEHCSQFIYGHIVHYLLFFKDNTKYIQNFKFIKTRKYHKFVEEFEYIPAGPIQIYKNKNFKKIFINKRNEQNNKKKIFQLF